MQILLQILVAIGLLYLVLKIVKAIFTRALLSLIDDEERSIRDICKKSNVSTETKSYRHLETLFVSLKFILCNLTFRELVQILGSENNSPKKASVQTLISEICGDNPVLENILMKRMKQLGAIVLVKVVLTSPQFYIFLLRRKLIAPRESISPRKTFSEIKQEVFKRYA